MPGKLYDYITGGDTPHGPTKQEGRAWNWMKNTYSKLDESVLSPAARTAGRHWETLGTSAPGLQKSLAQEFGFFKNMDGGYGFMGINNSVFRDFFRPGGLPETADLVKARAISITEKGVVGGIGTIGRGAFKMLPLASNLYEAYQGYKEEGALGAVKGFGRGVAMTMGIELLGPLALPAALVIGAGVGTYGYMNAAGKYGKKTRKLNMIQDQVDAFGTKATLRQRSLSALQNTHINGRMAIGNEAAIVHIPFS